MSDPVINVGTSVEAAKQAGENLLAVLQQLDAMRATTSTANEALRTLRKMTEVKNTSIHNCKFFVNRDEESEGPRPEVDF